MLRHPFAWEALKRALSGGEVRIENLAEEYSAVPMATLRPEPIPLDVKVVLIGSPLLYHLLYQLDEDFRELFKVKVDFSPEMEWDDASVGALRRLRQPLGRGRRPAPLRPRGGRAARRARRARCARASASSRRG